MTPLRILPVLRVYLCRHHPLISHELPLGGNSILLALTNSNFHSALTAQEAILLHLHPPTFQYTAAPFGSATSPSLFGSFDHQEVKPARKRLQFPTLQLELSSSLSWCLVACCRIKSLDVLNIFTKTCLYTEIITEPNYDSTAEYIS